MASDLSKYISQNEVRQFLADAEENLNDLESALLEVDDKGADLPELVNRIFRAVHSIKGASAMFGYHGVERFVHGVEEIYLLVRKGEIGLSEPLVSATLKAHDLIGQMLRDGADEADAAGLLEVFQGFLPRPEPGRAAPPPPPPTPPPAPVSPVAAGAMRHWRVRFCFNPACKVFDYATNPLVFLDTLRERGPCQVKPITDALPDLERMDPSVCYLGWEAHVQTAASPEAIRGDFLFVEDDLSVLEVVPAEPEGANDATPTRDKGPARRIPPGRTPRILIADDEFANRLLLRKLLEPFGECDMVVDGEEAVEIFAAELGAGRPYDYVLLDILMPKLDGRQALREIRRLERDRRDHAECVVVMVTALDSPKEVFDAYYRGGCTDYLVKPISPEGLYGKLREYGMNIPG